MKNNLVQTLKLRGGSSVGFEFCPLDTAGVDDTQVKIASVHSIQHIIFFFTCYIALILFIALLQAIQYSISCLAFPLSLLSSPL